MENANPDSPRPSRLPDAPGRSPEAGDGQQILLRARPVDRPRGTDRQQRGARTTPRHERRGRNRRRERGGDVGGRAAGHELHGRSGNVLEHERVDHGQNEDVVPSKLRNRGAREPNIQLVHFEVNPPVWTLEPLVELYAAEMPDDREVQDVDGFLGKITNLGKQGFVIVARTSRPVGFAIAQVFRDDIRQCLCAIIHTAWIDPACRAKGLLQRALLVIEAWAREAEAEYIGCLSPNGTVLARMLHWQRVGRYLDRDYLVHPLRTGREASDLTQSGHPGEDP